MEETPKIAEESPASVQDIEIQSKSEEIKDMEEAQTADISSESVLEYDSAHSRDNCSEERSPVRRQSKHSGNETDESESDSEGSVILEREEGDGQESLPTRKIDHDEDKKNPQYIPKRGTFYEHDDRTADDIESEEVESPEKLDKDGKKKVWQDKKENWNHDRFNDNEQAPKSRTELIAIYGYDIRSEEGPPRARRRRRYGRGPNKYTRNWEDEDAYSKPPLHTKRAPRKSSHKQDGSSQGSDNEGSRDDSHTEGSQQELNREDTRSANAEEIDNGYSKGEPEESGGPPVNNDESEYRNTTAGPRVGTGRPVRPKREIKNLDYKGCTKLFHLEGRRSEQKVLPKQHKKDDYIQSQNFTNKIKPHAPDFEKDMSKLNINDGGYKNHKYNGQRQASVPPRLQNEQKGSKRYSSMRQRSLPETANPPFNQHSNFYPNEYNQQNQSTAPQQQQQPGLIQHPNPQLHSNPIQMPQIPPPPLAPLAQQVPVTTTPILQAPPQFAASFPQPPPNFLQPGVAPPPFIPQPAPQIINYVQGQPQYPPTPFQGYQQPFNTVTQPTELYQPQGGITYYSPQDQQQTQRAAPLKRPKAAIPIVPPPPHEPRGRGRSMLADNPNIGDGFSHSTQENNYKFEDASPAVSVEQ